MKSIPILFLLVLLPVFTMSAALSSRVTIDGSVSDGKKLFTERCSVCHTVGDGRKVGPDMYGITEIRPMDYLATFIQEPTHMFEAKNAIATMVLEQYRTIRMPDLHLSRTQILNLLAYLQWESSQPKPNPVLPFPEGDPGRGQGLYEGRVRFQKAGPPCISCHNISHLGFPRGGTMGPDLTGINPPFAAADAQRVFPTMIPLYRDHPLLHKEQQDLEAFIRQAAGTESTDVSAIMGLLAEGGFMIVFGIVWYAWRRRVRLVRAGLTRRTRPGGVQP